MNWGLVKGLGRLAEGNVGHFARFRGGLGVPTT